MLKLLLVGWIIGNGADLVTTEISVRQSQRHELNMYMRNPIVRPTIKISFTVSGVVAIVKLYHKHPRMVSWFVLSDTAVLSVVATHNAMLIR